MKKNIYLSICIPTYNRAQYLNRTLDSIVNQKVFKETNEVEIVICDNCSFDNTFEVVQNYISQYGGKIKYYKNEKNIAEANVEAVLKLGNGLFLKLNNDTLNHENNSLNKILDFIKRNLDQKPQLFFSNALFKENNKLDYYNIDSFLKTVSFYSTWIGCFGIWRDDVGIINNFDTIVKEKLIVNVLFDLIDKRRWIKLENSKIFKTETPKNKGGYNFYEVFVKNYLRILHQYNDDNQLSNSVLFIEKGKLMIKFLIPWIIILEDKKSSMLFETNRGFKLIWNEYKFHPILYLGFFYYLLRKTHKYIITSNKRNDD